MTAQVIWSAYLILVFLLISDMLGLLDVWLKATRKIWNYFYGRIWGRILMASLAYVAAFGLIFWWAGGHRAIGRNSSPGPVQSKNPAGIIAGGVFYRVPLPHPPNGSVTRMVSSRSGLVDSSVTGVRVSSSTRLIYFTALAGSSAQLRAP